MKRLFRTRNGNMLVVLVFAMAVTFTVQYLEDRFGTKAFYISAAILALLLLISISINYFKKAQEEKHEDY